MITPNRQPVVDIEAIETRINDLINKEGFHSISLRWHSHEPLKGEELNYNSKYGYIKLDRANAEIIGKHFAKAGYFVYLKRISVAYGAPTHVVIRTTPEDYSENIFQQY